MAMKKIRRGDDIVVLAGRDKGKRGKVLKVLADDRLLVSGIQMIKKHQKANPQMGVAGGVIDKEAPIDASNVAIFNPETNTADRVGFKVDSDGKKIRIFKSSGQAVAAS